VRARNHRHTARLAGIVSACRHAAHGRHVASDGLPPRPAVFSAGAVRAAVVVTAAASAVITAALALVPRSHRPYPWLTEHLALETAASLIALLACFLVSGRLRRRAALGELMLACGLALLALSNVGFVVVPTVAGWAPDGLTVWAAPVARSAGGLLFAVAAFVPDRRLRRPGPALAAGAAGVAAALLLTAVVADMSARPPLPVTASPAQDVLELAMAALFGAAAAGFLRQCRRRGDEFSGWLAAAAALALASRINYFWYSFTNSQSLYSGDAFLFACYAVLLLGSVREIWSYWHALSGTAVVEERQRIACDLHDGLAQELAFLARNLDSLRGTASEGDLARLRGAVERARVESRRAVSALAAPRGQPFEEALAVAVTEIAQRYGVEVGLDLAPGIRLSVPRREALVRIACEAVTNAARHSGACRIEVGVQRDGPGVRLRVSDAGRGFDVGAAGGGFGLVSMRERARSVGGELLVWSAPGRGSKVEVAA
jgi:signal transduction histidine kinase